MIDLAIYIDDNTSGTSIVETNQGDQMASPNWPQDSDFRLVVFTPGAKKCEVIWPEVLAADIALALQALERVSDTGRKKPDWHRRLIKCAAGAPN